MMLDRHTLNKLFRYCMALSGHRDDAYDLVQDSVEKYLSQKTEVNDHHALSIASDTAPNKFIILGAGCVLTPARCLLKTVDGREMVRLFPDEVVNRVEGINYDYLMLVMAV